jgi:hypothetical protein
MKKMNSATPMIREIARKAFLNMLRCPILGALLPTVNTVIRLDDLSPPL